MPLTDYSNHSWSIASKEVLEKMKFVQVLLDPVESQSSPISKRNWKLKNRQLPWSCTDEEGLLLYFTIVENNLKSGFEIATAFGYSTSYIGLAFQKTGGSCMTIDCYIEEFEGSLL